MTTTAPAVSEAVTFYGQVLPIVEQLLTMAREWRDSAPTDPQAIRAHSEMTWLAIRCDLRLNRYRAPADPAHHHRSARGRPCGVSPTAPASDGSAGLPRATPPHERSRT